MKYRVIGKDYARYLWKNVKSIDVHMHAAQMLCGEPSRAFVVVFLKEKIQEVLIETQFLSLSVQPDFSAGLFFLRFNNSNIILISI